MPETNDPIRLLETFGTGGVDVSPLDPTQVRRLGDRRRSRRRAALVAASAVVVAAVVTPLALTLGGGNEDGAPMPMTPSPEPKATVVAFPGVGVEVKAVSDTSKLEGTSDEFKTFIAGV